jgi:Domain of unknown function (DUF1992)
MAGVDDIIKQWVAQVEKTGELRKIPGWGKPLDLGDGFLETPTELRTAYKILKNAGYVPAEVEMLNRVAALKEQIAATDDAEQLRLLRVQLAEAQQKVAMMLDKLRGGR